MTMEAAPAEAKVDTFLHDERSVPNGLPDALPRLRPEPIIEGPHDGAT
jgi:hypothetical protein